MFGLSEGGPPRATASRAGKSKGVVLVRSPRRVSWLAGWTPARPGATAAPSASRAATVLPGPAAKPGNRP